MKISKLSIIGFKSFMDKLEIAFPMGISAIVGPNGCGKSNIVDAIRWAMGEQSAKQLRGRQMEDVIFNGAGDYKPYGMAEVSVIFENGDGSFPLEFSDYTEISVTRRLYRSGESEYLINSVPCRLKDIQEIFMDTGLGNKAYSIIGQGKISSIIEQKPEETRVMLEEAAGITKYRKKVEESLRKIELTKGNLQRVEDILGEVKRQMRALKRQASKAKRFKSISEEIERLELTLNANGYHQLKEESGQRVRSTEDLAQEEIGLSTEFSGIQAKVETMNLEREEQEREIARKRSTYLNLKEEAHKKESALESLASEKRMQMELQDRLKKEKEDTERRLSGLENERGILTEKVEKLKQNSKVLEREMALVEKRLRSRRELLKEVKEEYERARNKVNSGVTKELGLNQESGYLNKRIGEITDAKTRLEKEIEGVSLKIEKTTKASQRKTEARQALAQKFEDIEKDIVKGHEKREELDKIKKDIETDLKAAESDLNIYQTRMSSLMTLTDNFEGYKIGVRTVMKASDLKARREGRIKGLVADVIQVESQYEQAVEAVLADKLQYVIVQSQEDGKEAVDYLKVKAKGRGSFVSLKDLNGDKNTSHNNGFPLLRDLVSAPESYRPLVNALLSDTVLVEDLDQAISAWKDNGRDLCFVTSEGDMVDQRGVISGGKIAHSSHGLLARKREVKELKEKVTQCKKVAERLKTKLEKVCLEIENKETSLDGIMEEKWNCQENINESDKTIFQFSQELDQLERLSERISDELEKSGRERTKHTEALKRIESELRECEEKRKGEEVYLNKREVELKESEEEFEQIRNDMEEIKMDYRLSQEEERGLIREIERIDDFTHEAQKKIKRIEEDILGGQEKHQEFLEKEEALKEALEGLYEKLKLAEESVNRAEQERNEFLGKIREEDKRGEALRRDLDVLREKINRARLEQSEIGFKMNSLVEMVQEKFNLNLPDFYEQYLEDDFSEIKAKESLEHEKILRERLGEVNLTAIQEHDALKERHAFMISQREDLLNSIDSLSKAIKKINKTSKERFMKTFNNVDNKLKQVFPILFNGGTAGLKLIDETRPLESGVLVEVRPPGKKLSHMGLLSGGEKALVAMALLFAIYLIKPSPFCLLDEVDAPLDEANIDRFNDLLDEIKKYSQVILVTHNRRSMEIVDTLYGVTMERAGLSKIVSVSLQELKES
jgi:chromosome segregation protein